MHPLKKYLQENQLSLSEFGRILNITGAAVHFWIKGVNYPKYKHALKIEKITKGQVPVSTWGMILTPSGRMYKVEDGQI